MRALELAVDALAATRLTRLIAVDTFPPVERAREAAYQALPPEWAEGLHCSWCMSVWAGMAVAVARHVAPRAWGPVAYGLAVAQAAGTIRAYADQQATRVSAPAGGVVQ